MKLLDYGFPLEYISNEGIGVESISKYLIGGALAAGGGYGIYKAYNYLKNKNNKNTKKQPDIPKNKVDDSNVPEWMLGRNFLIKLIKEYPKKSEDQFFAIKSWLESCINLSKGDKFIVLKHIKWLKDNGYFHWEKDDGLKYNKEHENKLKEYYFEKERLVQNFTKERFDKVIELYKIYKEHYY